MEQFLTRMWSVSFMACPLFKIQVQQWLMRHLYQESVVSPGDIVDFTNTVGWVKENAFLRHIIFLLSMIQNILNWNHKPYSTSYCSQWLRSKLHGVHIHNLCSTWLIPLIFVHQESLKTGLPNSLVRSFWILVTAVAVELGPLLTEAPIQRTTLFLKALKHVLKYQ